MIGRRLWVISRAVGFALFACSAFVIAQPWQSPPGVIIEEATFQSWQAAVEGSLVEAGSTDYLNSLVLENSPYLLQHAHNPVNWVSWSEASLAEAVSTGKLIFLSIGYSTCHWCHVMNNESFRDPDIALLINENFVAIKVDREERPAVDQYYSNILTMVKGSAGWPLTAVLDFAGNPIFIEPYLSPEALTALLTKVVKLNSEQPEYLANSAALIASAAASGNDPTVPNSAPLSLDEFYEIGQNLLSNMDHQYGGIRGAQKFPNEAMLAYLSMMQQRKPDAGLRSALDLQLANMVSGGLYDHINGGFFRYSTDSFWRIPHYEKMLYNQALLLQIYSKAYLTSGDPLYRWVLIDLIGFLNQWLKAPDAGYYSAINADSEGREGGYYLWRRENLSQISQSAVKSAALGTYEVPGQSGWFGIYLAKPGTPAAGNIRAVLREQSSGRTKPFIDKKVITSWNAALISGLVSANRVLGDAREASPSSKIEAFGEQLWSSLYSTDKAVLYRAHYHGERTVVGTLEDYAYFLRALVDLYDMSGNKVWLDRSRLLADPLLDEFMGQGGSFTFVGDRVAPHIRQPGVIQDMELPAPDAVALEALWRLSIRLGDQRFTRSLNKPLNKLREKFRAHPYSQLYAGNVLAEVDLGSVSTRQYFASGHGQIKVSMPPGESVAAESCGSVIIDVSLESGWHVNSSSPLQDYLKPTKVHLITPGADSVMVEYPRANTTRLSFQEEPLSVYEGNFQISLMDEPTEACNQWLSDGELRIDVQACADQVCLAPETLRVKLPASP